MDKKSNLDKFLLNHKMEIAHNEDLAGKIILKSRNLSNANSENNFFLWLKNSLQEFCLPAPNYSFLFLLLFGLLVGFSFQTGIDSQSGDMISLLTNQYGNLL